MILAALLVVTFPVYASPPTALRAPGYEGLMVMSNTPQAPSEVWGKNVGIRLEWHDGELIETLMARDTRDRKITILKTPTAPGLTTISKITNPTAFKGANDGGLFRETPTMRFTRFEQKSTGAGTTVTLIHESKTVTIKKSITIPQTGNKLRVELTADFVEKRPLIEYLLLTYAFTPDGKALSKGGRPDSTFVPGFRPQPNQVVGDHQFRAPAATAQKDRIAAVILPDVEHLAENRPMPTIIDIDAKSGVADAALMSYGFCDYRVSAHVYFSHDPSMVRRVPNHLELATDIVLTADAEPFSAHQIAATETWKVGSRYLDKILPQAMPFEEYAKVCYPAAFNEAIGDNKLGYFEVEIDGKVCGGVCAGWGYQNGWVSWQPWFNNLRSAWGMRWWGKKLNTPDWVDKADKMLNLALAAPMDQGAVPTTYDSKKKEWLGCLIKPRPDCYYDLTNMAWKGIWMIEWARWKDCPRREEVLDQCRKMARYMIKHQNADGSFPTWLTKDHQVIPILDHSAQTALPAWFIAELSRMEQWIVQNPEEKLKITGIDWQTILTPAAQKAADFLVKHVVDKNLWYDFETFFSCSPKVCLQREGKIDDFAMWDQHSLVAPQNTLSMHWAAEALRSVSKLTKDKKYVPYALKSLDMMNLYQNVWPISYRKTAYTYGGFGVQNSDGEYDDARQAQFGASLCDFGAELGRKDYFERGVAATRASQTLINHPLHAEYGIYPNPNYPLGLQPENCCHGGTDHQAGRTGFDWGEGSGLTSMAWLLDKYGERYDKLGVIVDGKSAGIEMLKSNPGFLPVDPTFDFNDWRMKGWTIVGDFAEVPTYSTRYDFGVNGGGFIGTCEDGKGGFNDEYTGTITSQKFRVSSDKITLLVGGGSGEGVYVELIESAGERLYIERGRNREPMDRRTWDVSKFKDRVLQIRIVDREKGGWGHINVGDIRFE